MNSTNPAAAAPLLTNTRMRNAAGLTKFGASKKGKALFYLTLFIGFAAVMGALYIMWAGFSGQRDKKAKK